MSTIDYYNQNADAFIAGTLQADVSALYEHFERLLSPGASVLDLGCGSGRDSKHFIDLGYSVTAIDGSKELCQRAERYLGMPVQTMLFQDLDFCSDFDGVWACASLLHVPKCEIQGTIKKVADAVKPGGAFYASFKYGSEERLVNDRLFSDFLETDIPWLTKEAPCLSLHEHWISGDVRDERHSEKWLNIIWLRDKVDPTSE